MKQFFKKLFSYSYPKFAVCGLLATVVDTGLYFLLDGVLGSKLAKLISMLASSITSYLLNKFVTFQAKEKTNAWQLIRFYLVFAASILVDVYGNEWLLNLTGNKVFAFATVTILSGLVNYFGQKFFVFRKKKRDPEIDSDSSLKWDKNGKSST